MLMGDFLFFSTHTLKFADSKVGLILTRKTHIEGMLDSFLTFVIIKCYIIICLGSSKIPLSERKLKTTPVRLFSGKGGISFMTHT